MTAVSDHPMQSATSGTWRVWALRIATWPQALTGYFGRRAAIKTLHQLDDRALRDIGISRSQIEAAVGGAMNPWTAIRSHDARQRFKR